MGAVVLPGTVVPLLRAARGLGPPNGLGHALPRLNATAGPAAPVIGQMTDAVIARAGCRADVNPAR
jgi:hypothetical protein